MYTHIHTHTHTHTHTIARRDLTVYKYQLQSSKHMELPALLTVEVGSVSEEHHLLILGINNA